MLMNRHRVLYNKGKNLHDCYLNLHLNKCRNIFVSHMVTVNDDKNRSVSFDLAEGVIKNVEVNTKS